MEVKEAAMDQSVDVEEEDDDHQVQGLPPDASETIYIKNLNEKVKLSVMRQSLQHLFSVYAPVLSVTLHGNLRMRGQAFVSFASKQPAAKAVKEVVGFPLYGKPMQLFFARTNSDAVIDKNAGSDELQLHKKNRLEHKKHSRTAWRRRQMALKLAKERGEVEEIAPGQPRRHGIEMPDEYLPPNKILFIHNVPDSVSREDLDALFRPHPGLVDVRVIPGRGVAFVEYVDAMQSAAARDALNSHSFKPGEKLRITFAK